MRLNGYDNLEGFGMNKQNGMMKRIAKLSLVLLLGASMSACAGLFGFGGTNWKEEVLLYDGSKIVVKRSVERGGRHELGQKPPYKEQSLSFTMPSTNQTITWEDHYSEDIGSASFLPMTLDIHQGTAYLVADTMGCLSYNKWGRPNPPYVIFKHDGKEWKRVALQDLPAEIKLPNLIMSMPDVVVERMGKSFVTAEEIQRIISNYPQPEYRSILREPLAESELCPDWSSGRYRSSKPPLPMKPIKPKVQTKGTGVEFFLMNRDKR